MGLCCELKVVYSVIGEESIGYIFGSSVVRNAFYLYCLLFDGDFPKCLYEILLCTAWNSIHEIGKYVY